MSVGIETQTPDACTTMHFACRIEPEEVKNIKITIPELWDLIR